MKLLQLVPVCLAFVAGCVVPHYGIESKDHGSAGGSSAGSGGSKANDGGDGSGAMSGGGAANQGGSSNTDCPAGQKSCDGECVDIDDVRYGCTETSCNMSACPDPGLGTLSCADGACVIGSCGTGSKKCGDKCVSVTDPTYGCSDTGCDATACPDPGAGTLVCTNGACVVGDCGADTKKCGNLCVPTDANHGCSTADSCDACNSWEICTGDGKCGCVPDNVEACKGVACGSVLNNCHQSVDCKNTCVSPDTCGQPNTANANKCFCSDPNPCDGVVCGSTTNACGDTVDCGNNCQAPTPACNGNACVECNVAADCPDNQGNVCAVATCSNHKCGFNKPKAGTHCGSFQTGTCSTSIVGSCEWQPSDAGLYNIDATEVTRGQYAAFVKEKNGDTSGQAAYCSWNNDYTPGDFYPPELKDYQLPVTWVDWCDAAAYCKWAGRRLCGKIGGGAVGYSDYADPTLSQWTQACMGPSKLKFPYGAVYDPTKCNTGDSGQLAPVGSFDQCDGAYTMLFDMSGNVMELQDACNGTTGKSDQCMSTGGAIFFTDDTHPGELERCSSGGYVLRNAPHDYLGFRCCSQ